MVITLAMSATRRICAEQGCRTPLSRYNKATKCFVHDKGVPQVRDSWTRKSVAEGHREPQPPNTLTSSEVCRATGVTYRILNHWVKRGFIEGQGDLQSGLIRYWTYMQLIRVQELVWLKEDIASLCEARGLPPSFAGNASSGSQL